MPKVVAWGLLAIAIALLGAAFWDAFEVARLLSSGLRAEGTVRAVVVHEMTTPRWSQFGGGQTTTTSRTATVAFDDDAGLSHEAGAAPTLGRVSVGDPAHVWYPPGRPDDGRAFVGWPWTWSLLVASVAALVGGLAYVAYAWGRYLGARRRERESNRPPGRSPAGP